MDNDYLIERGTLVELVDALLSKKYPNGLPENINAIREENIKKLDDKITKDLFDSFTESQLTDFNELLDKNVSDPQVFRNFFKDANIDLEQQIEKSVREFSAEFLGGENA